MKPAKDFVFLNINSYSDSKRYKYAVKSHVSGAYRRQNKRKEIRRLSPPVLTRIQTEALQRSADGQVFQQSQKRQREESPDELAVVAWKRDRLSIHALCFAGTRVDPFGLYPIEATIFVKDGLDFYDHVYVDTQEPVFALSISDNPHREWVLPTAMHNVDSCHAAVALALTLRQLWSLRTDPVVTTQIELHRRAAISHVRNSLGRAGFYASDSILISVVIFASLDLLKGDPVSFFYHWMGLKMLIATRGGLDNLGRDGKIKAALMEYDLCFMLLTRSSRTLHPAGSLPPDAYPKHPFTTHLLLLIKHLPYGFQELAYRRLLCTDVIKILHRAQIPFAHRKMIPVDVDVYAVASDLHHSPEPKYFEKCICFAIMVWEHITFSEERDPTMAFRAFRKALGEFLPLVEWKSEPERQCAIWMWAILVESWRFRNTFLKEGLDAQRTMIEKFPDMMEWCKLDQVLFKYFWNVQLQSWWSSSWENYLRAPILPPLQVPSPTAGTPTPLSAQASATSATTPLQLPFAQSLTSAEAQRAQNHAAASLATPPETPPASESPLDAARSPLPRISPRSSQSPQPDLSNYAVVMR